MGCRLNASLKGEADIGDRGAAASPEHGVRRPSSSPLLQLSEPDGGPGRVPQAQGREDPLELRAIALTLAQGGALDMREGGRPSADLLDE
eukprot:12329547-Alexandrium_andersonii.AAC.1